LYLLLSTHGYIVCCLSIFVCRVNIQMVFLDNDVLENIACYVCLGVVCVMCRLGMHVCYYVCSCGEQTLTGNGTHTGTQPLTDVCICCAHTFVFETCAWACHWCVCLCMFVLICMGVTINQHFMSFDRNFILINMTRPCENVFLCSWQRNLRNILYLMFYMPTEYML